ncbi:hypothetical protein [Segatella copri]|jgi:hypothetical protein|uniref:hypothetical protein n=1 Tax=Segatella copri TaxID=165179 RepID=UPI0012914E71|nr:hypothetical protein [Segatella copri]DAI63075.1 MAG TPA: hypothetical protein [Caudoviricetes sp.]MBV3429938.1 hypothetical protein [Segatella copri]MQM90270.1 hypothetical protein [Segatella copri]MQM95811.1 hypothetical protein [Segatella copri]MQN03852.1 hypothetical protein [Segatella copri]
MAQRINRRLSRIENFFSMLLTKGKISDNIFVGELPPTTSKDWDDFVNVDVGQQREHGGYSSGYANIYLYARPKGTPLRKNVKLLDKMEGILDDVIKQSNNKDYTIQVLYRDSGYDSNRQFHFQMISVSVIAR